MGLFGGGNNAGKGASKSSRYLLEGLNRAERKWMPAYNAAIGRIDPTIAEVRDWLTQGRDSVLGAYGNAYNTATGAINTGLENSLQSLGSGYSTARGDVSSSLAAQLAAINQAQQQGQAYYQPYVAAGQAGLDRALQLTTPGQQFTAMQADPGYQWRLSQGLEGVTNSASGRGGVFGGNTLMALNDYAQNQASAEFGNVYDRNARLAQIGLGAASGSAGLSQWAGGAGAAANQWAGGLNSDLARWLASGQAGLQTGAAGNLANLATGYGQQQAGTLGGYYGSQAALTGSAADQRTQLELARAGMMADYDVQKANANAARETAQANMAGSGWGPALLGLAGTLGGAALGNPYIGSAIGSGLGSLFGGGSQSGAQGGIAGIGGGGTWGGAGGYGYGSNNPWLTGNNRVG